MQNFQDITIRLGEQKDLKAVYALIHELAVFEHEPNEPSNLFSDFEIDFAQNCFELLVAELGGEIIGITLFHAAYSSWKGRMIYLDDFVISKTHRGKGIGKQLFDSFIEIGKKRNINQLRWHVLDWNDIAIDFYKNYHCTFDEQWITCKLEKDKLA